MDPKLIYRYLFNIVWNLILKKEINGKYKKYKKIGVEIILLRLDGITKDPYSLLFENLYCGIPFGGRKGVCKEIAKIEMPEVNSSDTKRK